MSTNICDLPHHITTLVFKGVPFSSVCDCREVYKEWNSLIMSPEFTPLTSARFDESISRKPMLVENDHIKGYSIRIYSLRSSSWESMSLPFLQDATQRKPLYLTASSGGLMCFETDDRQSFIICNPITQRFRHLQLPVAEDENSSRVCCNCLNPTFCIHGEQNIPDTLTGLIVDRQTDSYKLIVASSDGSRGRKTLIYDSLKRSWTTGAQVPEGEGFVNPVALSVKGNLYCLIVGQDGKMVAKYDAQQDIWSCSAPLNRDIVPFFLERNELELVEHRGGVKLLARVTHRQLGYRPFYDVGCMQNWSGDISVLTVYETSGRLWVGRSQLNRENQRGSHERDISDQAIKSRLSNAASYQDAARPFQGEKWEALASKYSLGYLFVCQRGLASAYAASFAGHNSTLYALSRVEPGTNEPGLPNGGIYVLKANLSLHLRSSEAITLLPSFTSIDPDSDKQIELRVFEPSLTGQV